MRKQKSLLRWPVATFAFATLAYAFMLGHVVYSGFTDGFGIFTMFGAPAGLALFAWYVLDDPERHERWVVIAGGIALEVLRVKTIEARGIHVSVNNLSVYFGSTAAANINIYFGFVYGFGLALGMVTTLALWWETAKHRWRDDEELFQLLCIMRMQVGLIYSMWLVSLVSLRVITYDNQLHHFETTLGVYVPALVALWFERLPALKIASQLAYAMLAGGVLAGYFLQLRQKRCPPVNILTATAIAALGTLIYFIVPGCGPLEIFGSRFPHSIPFTNYAAYTLHPAVALWRNAMPSLHATWAMLLWINLWYYHPSLLVKWGVAVFAALVLLATLGTGAHYFVDLVVAVPLTLAVQALASTSLPWCAQERWQPIAVGSAMVLGWLLLLCLVPQFFSLWRAWAMITLTIAVSYALLVRLIAATKM